MPQRSETWKGSTLLSLLLLPAFSTSACGGGFDDHVFIESASFVLVAESQSSLSTIFGHGFLKLESKRGTHALSYYNTFDSTLKSFAEVVTGHSEGVYVLMPYKEMRDSYIKKQRRSLWEFELQLSEQEKAALKERIGELEGLRDTYNFVHNNCCTQMEKLLCSVNPSFEYAPLKTFKTPLEYAKFLTKQHLVDAIRYLPAGKTTPGDIPRIWEYPSTTKFSLGRTGKGTMLELASVYHDKNQPRTFERDVDTRILGLSLHLADDFDTAPDAAVDLFRLTAYEALTTSVELRYHDGFTCRAGLGSSMRGRNVLCYIIPYAGVRENKPFVSSTLGITIKGFNRLSGSAEYDRGSDGSRLKCTLTCQIHDDMDIQLSCIREKGETVFSLGMGMYF